MPKSLCKAIALLLVLALPTQGFVAAGMLACSAGHARMAASAQDDNPASAARALQHDHASHNHATRGAHGQVPQPVHVRLTAQIGDVVTTAGALNTQADSKCSACAACCIGIALLSGNLLPGTPEFSLPPLLAVSTAPVSFITDGPVRPPRSFLA